MEDFHTQHDLEANVITKENQYDESGIGALVFVQIIIGLAAAGLFIGGMICSEHYDTKSLTVPLMVMSVILVIFTILIEPIKTIVKAAKLYINEHELKYNMADTTYFKA